MDYNKIRRTFRLTDMRISICCCKLSCHVQTTAHFSFWSRFHLFLLPYYNLLLISVWITLTNPSLVFPSLVFLMFLSVNCTGLGYESYLLWSLLNVILCFCLRFLFSHLWHVRTTCLLTHFIRVLLVALFHRVVLNFILTCFSCSTSLWWAVYLATPSMISRWHRGRPTLFLTRWQKSSTDRNASFQVAAYLMLIWRLVSSWSSSTWLKTPSAPPAFTTTAPRSTTRRQPWWASVAATYRTLSSSATAVTATSRTSS